jgi:hypothetical protein
MIRKLLYTAMKFNKYSSFIMLDCLGGDKHMLGCPRASYYYQQYAQKANKIRGLIIPEYTN